MEWLFELTLNTSASRFEQWLKQYTPDSIPDYYHPGNGKAGIYIGTPTIINSFESKYIKILGTPYLKDDSENARTYEIDVGVGDLATIQGGVDSVVSLPLLNIIEVVVDKTTIKIHMKNVDISPYIKDMTSEIARIWPETKREVAFLDIIDGVVMDDILFDFVIEAHPKNFMSWIHDELKESYPGAFTHEIGNREYHTHMSGDIFPPDNYTPYWEYFIFADDIVFEENETTGKVEAYKEFSGAIVRIEIRHISNNRHHLKCFYGTDHPQILEWLENFMEVLISIYQPVQFLKPDTQGEDLKKERLTNKVEAKNEQGMPEKSLQVRAKELRIHPTRLQRWDEIIELRRKGALTQVQLADRFCVSVETIKKDFRDMKDKGYFQD